MENINNNIKVLTIENVDIFYNSVRYLQVWYFLEYQIVVSTKAGSDQTVLVVEPVSYAIWSVWREVIFVEYNLHILVKINEP